MTDERPEVVIVEPEPETVEVLLTNTEIITVNDAIPGPRGPQGPPGKDAGSLAAVSEVFVQNVASDTWTFVYDLEYIPTVTVVDSAGSTVEGEVRYKPDHVIEIKFAVPFSGTAYLS
jgi:hypothetical protein